MDHFLLADPTAWATAMLWQLSEPKCCNTLRPPAWVEGASAGLNLSTESSFGRPEAAAFYLP